jgi:hypothetical protein
MHDIIRMIISALGAAAIAAAILAGLCLAASSVVAVLKGLVGGAVLAIPAAICLGGAAYAASRIGYGKW